MHVNFGFGIGAKYKEDELSINANNSTKVEPGMCFHVRITFRDVTKEKSKSFIAIGDTVIVQEDGTPKLLTESVSRKYQNISYTLDDEDEQEQVKEDSKSRDIARKSTAPDDGQVLNSRTRGAAVTNEKNIQLEENLRSG